ncbi:AbrB family transcriptional regulator [Rossellomorea marisflavi]|uniref:AbrB family transcriptional regulator n=1 Tax=Rossellomorea marisflavi TaxID=189381 RepID=UPI002079EF3E|nr:AbrB family transcriptional regulator [Rossellomorea marisflavi]USK92574.1 AbrB family transcriptional regulator [Rossellomorea marisflavi]
MRILASLIVGFLGGGLFTLLHIPLSWMLGAMVSMFIVKKWGRFDLKWPPLLRNLALVIVGYSIGHSFSKRTVVEIFTQLPTMLLMTIFIIVFSMGLAFIITKTTGINLASTITGSVPGGLSQMVVLGEEMKNVNLTVVTILQVVRVLSVVCIVPFLVFSPLLGGEAANTSGVPPTDPASFRWELLLFFAVAVITGLLAKKIRFPTPFLLGPILVIGGCMIGGAGVPDMPGVFIILAQLSLGIYFSFMLDISPSRQLTAFILWSVVTSIGLLAFSIGLSFLLSSWHHISFMTAFISLSPGGMAEMALLGHAVGADLSIITGYHLFRILFILFLMPPVLKAIFKLPYFKEPDNPRRASS